MSDELGESLGELLAHALDRLGRPDPGDDVLALGVREELAEEHLLARRGVAREAHARPRALAAIPEHHLDDIHRGADLVRDVVGPPVDLGARRVPRVEHCAVRAAELFVGVLREGIAGRVLVDLLVGLDQLAEILRCQLDVLAGAARGLEISQRLLEAVAVDAVDDLAVHLDQPAVGVPREAGVPGRRSEAFDRRVVQAEVEDRVHHPGHRHRRPGADRDEERIRRIAETPPCALLERRDVLRDLLVEPLWNLPARGHVGAACIGGHGEAGGHGDPETGHLGEADALSPEKLATAARVLVEVEDVAHLREESTPVARAT